MIPSAPTLKTEPEGRGGAERCCFDGGRFLVWSRTGCSMGGGGLMRKKGKRNQRQFSAPILCSPEVLSVKRVPVNFLLNASQRFLIRCSPKLHLYPALPQTYKDCTCVRARAQTQTFMWKHSVQGYAPALVAGVIPASSSDRSVPAESKARPAANHTDGSAV